MSLTPANYQQLLIDTLSFADPTSEADLQNDVGFYWSLFARKAYQPELRYWYTRRELIAATLMPCAARQVDFMRRAQSATRTALQSSQQDSTMQATSVEDSSSQADRSMNSASDDETNASGAGSSSLSRTSTDVADSESLFTDIGNGSGSSSASGTMTSTGSETGSGNDHNDWDSNENRSHVVALASSSSITQSGIGAAGSSYTSIGYSGGHSGSTDGSGTSSRFTTYSASQSNLRVSNRNASNSSDATNSFNANSASSDNATANMLMQGDAESEDMYTMLGAGTGSSLDQSDSSSQFDASSNRTSQADGEAHNSSQAVSEMQSTMERLHQNFLHLQELWTKANETVKWFESQRLVLPAYVIRQITIQYPEGVSSGLSLIANQYLVTQPRAS